MRVCCTCHCMGLFFFKQKTAYEMRISDWSSDVCSSDLALDVQQNVSAGTDKRQRRVGLARCHCRHDVDARIDGAIVVRRPAHEGEDRAWTEGDDARAAVDDRVSRDAPEADPLFVALLDPGHLDRKSTRLTPVTNAH